ncbi:syntaxin/t-SNARE family protein isoform X2 [Wolffia australiana]
MASGSTFDRWEKDPLFSAAEEVQESTDRMESIYRRWIREKKRHMNSEEKNEAFEEPELRRELQAALGTAKWQLEEFDRASQANFPSNENEEDSRTRRSQFVVSIGIQIRVVEDSLKESEVEDVQKPLIWVRLDEGERDELAMFLAGPHPVVEEKKNGGQRLPPQVPNDMKIVNREIRIDLPKRSFPSNMKPCANDAIGENKKGHRRSASVGGDLGAWRSSVLDEDLQQRSLEVQPDVPPQRVLSFSGLSMAAESTWKIKWVANGFRKLKGGEQHRAQDSIPLKNDHLTRGLKTFYDKSKSCLSDCGDESYKKQLYGCLGTLQRQLQRSQYQIQYRRPIQVFLSVVLALLLIVLFTLRAI